MTFQPVADMPIAGHVYAEGWQGWSRLRLYRAGEPSDPLPDERSQVIEGRPGQPAPSGVLQGEGVLAIAGPDGPARAWFSPQPSREVASMRLAVNHDRLELSANAPVEELLGADLDGVLAAVGDRLGTGHVTSIPPGWCSWSCYFKHVTEREVLENVEAARRLALPIEIVQLDDGYETDIGDWLSVRPEFGSLQRVAEGIGAAGMRPGIWTAPFMVSPTSALATRHPEWLVKGIDAGTHWGLRMRILDVSNSAAAAHLTEVFHTLAGWGFSYFKVDFLYAGAIPGLEPYRHGMRLIRDAAGPDAIVVACGAPLLPSIGLCDVMRVGPDVLREAEGPQLNLEELTRVTRLRKWMNGRLWVNDPDHLVARPEIAEREAWASYLETYGGQRFSSDRLAALDARGLELTRRVLGAAV